MSLVLSEEERNVQEPFTSLFDSFPGVCDAGKRHDMVIVFDVSDGNPNGDPDAGNLPRIDPETMQGLVSDGAIKRKIRNCVDAVKGHDERYKIYVQNKGILNNQHLRAYTELEKRGEFQIPDKEDEKKRFLKNPGSEVLNKARDWMCANFYDVRAFGAMMSTDINCGQVRGPVQVTFARSVDPISPLDVSITRVALTNPDDIKGGSAEDEEARAGQMGRKSIVPYGLYVAYGFHNALLGRQTGFNDEDLALLYYALINMWDLDRSASRGMMALRRLIVFTHSNELGSAPAHKLFDTVKIVRRQGVEVPRRFEDYEVAVDEGSIPEGVTLHVLV